MVVFHVSTFILQLHIAGGSLSNETEKRMPERHPFFGKILTFFIFGTGFASFYGVGAATYPAPNQMQRS